MRPPRSPEQVFQELDVNKDGVISKDEFLKRHAPSGTRNDTKSPEPSRPGAPREGFGIDRPGPFGSGPFGPGQGPGPFGRGLFSDADTDKDGAVSKSELEEHLKKRFPGQKPDSGDNRPRKDESKPPSA